MAAVSDAPPRDTVDRLRCACGSWAIALALLTAGCTASGTSNDLATTAIPESAAWSKLVDLGDKSRADDEPTTALQFYRQAHLQAPDEPLPLILIGETLIEVEDPLEASAAFRRALDLQPGNTRALLGLGSALIRLDQPLAALQQFEVALNQDPDDIAALSGAGVAADLAGERDRAQAYLRRGLEREPDSVTLLNNLGYSLILSGDYREAIALLEMATALPEATAQHRQNLALAYGLAGREAEAARMIRMDFGDDEVARNLTYYRARRDRSSVRPTENSTTPLLNKPIARSAPVGQVEAEPETPRSAHYDDGAKTLDLGDFVID